MPNSGSIPRQSARTLARSERKQSDRIKQNFELWKRIADRLPEWNYVSDELAKILREGVSETLWAIKREEWDKRLSHAINLGRQARERDKIGPLLKRYRVMRQDLGFRGDIEALSSVLPDEWSHIVEIVVA